MSAQMTLDDVALAPCGQTSDEYDQASGLTGTEWATCAQWCLDHPEAARYIVWRAALVNKTESRPASMRLDIEPELAKRAREYGLLVGTYRGLDHRLTAPLARYLMWTRRTKGLRFTLRARAGDRVKNNTPFGGDAAA